jgi:hypothetical protein
MINSKYSVCFGVKDFLSAANNTEGTEERMEGQQLSERPLTSFLIAVTFVLDINVSLM